MTGLAGVWLQRIVPSLISRRLTVEAIYERIPELVRAPRRRGGRADDGRAGRARARLRGEIRPVLAEPRDQRDVADRHGARQRWQRAAR